MKILLILIISVLTLTTSAQTFEHEWMRHSLQNDVYNPTNRTAITRTHPDGGALYVTLDESKFSDSFGEFGTITIIKVNETNQGEWGMSLGPEVKIENVEVNEEGRVFVAGFFYNDMIFSNGETLPFVAAGFALGNMFIICFESNGEVAWTKNLNTNLDGIDPYFHTGFAIGNNGQVHYAYTTFGDAYFGTLDTNGELVSSFEASGIQFIGGLKCDSENNLYVSGSLFQGPVIFPSFSGDAPFNNNAFIAKINADGNGGWIRFYLDITTQFVSLALNSNEQPIIVYTLYINILVDDIPVTVSYYGEEFGLIQLDQNGNAIWATSLVDETTDGEFSLLDRNAVRTDNVGGIWIAGQVEGYLDFGHGVTIDSGNSINKDGAIIRFNEQGHATTAAYLSGGGNDKIWSFDIIPNEGLYYTTYCTEAYNPTPLEMPSVVGQYRVFAKLSAEGLTSIEESASEESFRIYPNPANDNFQISSLSIIEGVEILDLQGRKVLDKTLSPARQQTLSIKELPAGVYVVKTNGSVLRLVKN